MRADQIIVLSPTGTVAEQGTYAELTSNPESQFIKLMEWQMSGGEPPGSAARTRRPPLELEHDVLPTEAVDGEEGGEPAHARTAGSTESDEPKR